MLLIKLILASPKWVQFTISNGGPASTGGISVFLIDKDSVSVYTGPATTWSGFVDELRFPLQITVTPTTAYQVYQKSGLYPLDANALSIILQPTATTSTIKYTLLNGSAPYTGSVRVVITDKSNNVVKDVTVSTYTTTLNSDKFPISIVVTPSAPFIVYTKTNVGATEASNMQITLTSQGTTSDTSASNNVVGVAVGASIGGAAFVGLCVGGYFWMKAKKAKAAQMLADKELPMFPPQTPSVGGTQIFQGQQNFGYPGQPIGEVVPATGQVFQPLV